ncbi:MAG TPA: I78 family peptidase inhibitor [Thermohalobaculum sp.]|nr:I78 family peptidase inhibitor [Thermohalobaculum sp.]
MRILAIAALALAACSSGIIGDPGTSYGPRGRGDGCDAGRYQTLVGQPRASLQGQSLPAPVRLIGPGTAVTMDYAPGRMNIRYDEQGIIVEVYCG